MLSAVNTQLDKLSSRQQAFSAEFDPRADSKFVDFYVRLIPRVLNAERCSVFIHDPANGKVWLKAGTALPERGIEVSVQNSIVGEVIASGKPVVASDLQGHEGIHKAVDAATGFVTREVMCVPIHSMDHSKITGAIQVLNKKSADRFSAEDEVFLEEVGEHFQKVVESVYLGQEAIAITRSAVAGAARVTLLGLMSIGVGVFLITLFGVYGGLPLIFR